MIYSTLFYWFSWLLWVIFTFFLKRSKERTVLCYWILFSIFTSNYYIKFGDQLILLPYVFLLIIITMFYTKRSNKWLYFFTTFTVVIGYMGASIWQENTTISLFFPTILFVPVCCSILILILFNGLSNRLIAGILGITIGEFFFNIILLSYQTERIFGDKPFFITLFIIVFLVYVFTIIQNGYQRFYVYSKRRMSLGSLY